MRAIAWAIALLSAIAAVGGRAQGQCPPADAVVFPVDTTRFRLQQAYGAPSPRHQGRYHTGEDWGAADALGAPVRALANGRVTFASPNGWGADGGVILIEHRFGDGTIVYSHYGHLSDSDGVRFPAVLSCVNAGDVIASIGDARPAPHLHLELRRADGRAAPGIDGTTPGAGYVWDDPDRLGLIAPSLFFRERNALRQPGIRWLTRLNSGRGAASPPVVLPGGGVLLLDGDRLLGVTNDGRILWRVVLDGVPVALLPQSDAGAAVVFADGAVVAYAADGMLAGRWRIDANPIAYVTRAGDRALFSDAAGGLIALSADGRSVVWRVADVDSVRRAAANDTMIAVIGIDGRLQMIAAADGTLIRESRLRDLGALTVSADGRGLLAYTIGGAWRIRSDGEWALLAPTAPPGGAAAAIADDAAGWLYAYDGETLYGYDPSGAAVWSLPDLRFEGVPRLLVIENALLLASDHGDLVAVQARTGALCRRISLGGDVRARLETVTTGDGVVRIHVGGRFLGIDWRGFLGACA